MSNKERLEHLFELSRIDIRKGNVFDSKTEPRDIDFDKVRGMLLGLAVGDSLGATTESMLPEKRHKRHGDITDYLPNEHANGQRVGLPTDDTQMTFWTLEQILNDGRFRPGKVAEIFCSGRRIYGIGGSVREFIANYKQNNKPWYEAGVKSAGNGALMRIPSVLVPHIEEPSTPWIDTALASLITHNDSASISACVSFNKMLWELLEMNDPPNPNWWIDTYVNTAKRLEDDDSYKPRKPSVKYEYPEGTTLWKFADREVRGAYQMDLSSYRACEFWYSGAYLLETLPSVLYILMRYQDDPEEAIIRAVTDTKDNDTIGAIVGAAVGALHGVSNLPERWISDLSGRTQSSDNNRIFELLNEAESEFA
jgi:ADP-ribosylglycohydrolase